MKKTCFCVQPCPCGYYGDAQKPCTCAPTTVTKYQKRISGPILDRIDIRVEAPRVGYEKLSSDWLGESSASIQERVRTAMNQLNLSARGNHRVLTSTCGTGAGKLARTIADLAGREDIRSVHLAETLQNCSKLTLG